MWLALVLGAGLALAQVPSETEETPPAVPAVERWWVQKLFQGTFYGALCDDHKIRVYGWTDVSFTGSSAHVEQLPMGFNYRANQFLLQQNWLRIEKPLDPKATSPAFGFRLDTILPGSDARFTVARGLADGQFFRTADVPAKHGIDPVQFYAEAAIPQVGRGLILKAGRFFAQYGYESIDATQNAFVSHSYTFIYDPFTHTGGYALLQLDDAWSVMSGLVLGSDVFLDPAATPTFIGSVKWAPPKGRDSVLFAVILSDPRFDVGENFNRPQIFDVVYTHKLNDRASYVLEALYGYQLEVPGIGFANWYGVVQYLTWQLDPQLTGTVRLEFFDDVQGQRTNFAGLYTAVTAGVNYRPRPDVVLRPEVRYDYNEQSRPFEGKKGLFTAALDVLLRW